MGDHELHAVLIAYSHFPQYHILVENQRAKKTCTWLPAYSSSESYFPRQVHDCGIEGVHIRRALSGGRDLVVYMNNVLYECRVGNRSLL